MGKMIDLSRPLMFEHERHLPEDERRQIHLVGVLKNGAILIESSEGKNWVGPHRYDSLGNAFHTGPVIVNAPKKASGTYPLDVRGWPFGRGLVTPAMAMSEYPDVKYFVEIIREDDVPIKAAIHVR